MYAAVMQVHERSERRQAHPAALVGEVVARTFRLGAVQDVQEAGVLYRAAHVVRPEPFCLLVLDEDATEQDAQTLAWEAAASMVGRRSTSGRRADFVQQGRCRRLGRRFVAWPEETVERGPSAWEEPTEADIMSDPTLIERRLTGQLPVFRTGIHRAITSLG